MHWPLYCDRDVAPTLLLKKLPQAPFHSPSKPSCLGSPHTVCPPPLLCAPSFPCLHWLLPVVPCSPPQDLCTCCSQPRIVFPGLFMACFLSSLGLCSDSPLVKPFLATPPKISNCHPHPKILFLPLFFLPTQSLLNILYYLLTPLAFSPWSLLE